MSGHSARIVVFLLCLVLMSGRHALAEIPGEKSSKETEKRIDRVTKSLLPDGLKKGKFAGPARIAERMKYFHTPGVSIAVINNFHVEWAKGFGVTEHGKKAPITQGTLFQAGSVSKPVFAVAIMKLVQEGKLNLDEDINHYLTSWKVPASGNWQPRVTLRQILSHSAGFTVHGFPGYPAGSKIPSLIEILNGQAPANTPPVKVDIVPGTQFRYSGGGITVAQQMIIDVMHSPFPKIMDDLIFAPMTLRNSTFEQPLPPTRAKQASTAHPEGSVIIPGKWHTYPEMAAAGLWTTPSDLARIGIELQMALRGEKDHLLSPETVTQMLTSGIDEKIGIGFMLKGKGKNARFSHGGWDAGFVASATFYKELGMGAVVMVNSNEGNPLLFEIERAIAKEYEWPEYFEEVKKVATLDSKSLKAIEGDYSTKSGIALAISEENSHVYLKLKDQNPIEIKPEAETKFFSDDLNAEVNFEKDSKGKIRGLTLQQEGGTLTAERK